MSTTNSIPRDVREYRRMRAVELCEAGWKQCDVAEALAVSTAAVSTWFKAARLHGEEALKSRGRPPRCRLDIQQQERLSALLAKGPEAFGFRGERWTQRRVAQVVDKEFGIHYHPFSMYRLLRLIGWSVQKPVKRATQRDEEAIEQWRDEVWPAIKQTPKPRDGR